MKGEIKKDQKVNGKKTSAIIPWKEKLGETKRSFKKTKPDIARVVGLANKHCGERKRKIIKNKKKPSCQTGLTFQLSVDREAGPGLEKKKGKGPQPRCYTWNRLGILDNQ